MRASGRAAAELRRVIFERRVSKHAEGSCLVRFGDTHVLCTATVEDRLPPWLKGQNRGWVTAEYGMLPRSTNDRMRREASAGKQSGRTQEIQRLIGRSLRAVVNLPALGENQITIDCDVLQADGGTRTAAITGGWIALRDALDAMVNARRISVSPLRDHVDYAEDSTAETDANFVATGTGGIVEIQATAEGAPFAEARFLEMLSLAKVGIAELVSLQQQAVS
jgi:ribonuclease PH